MNQINVKIDVGNSKYCNDCPIVKWLEGECPLFDENLEATYEADDEGWVNKKLLRCDKCLDAEVEESKINAKECGGVYRLKIDNPQ